MSHKQNNILANLASKSRLNRPMIRARVARAFRALADIPGWQGLVNRIVREHSAPFSVINKNIIFIGDIGSYIDRQVYLFGGYESAQIKCFLSLILREKRGTILDIGANVGTHSLAFANIFETVHSFEPNPMLWDQFEENMRANGFANVNLHKLGLADRDSNLTLYMIDKLNYGLGTFSMVEQYDLPLRAFVTCPIRHAGDYIAEIVVGRVDAVKIDVQGFEPEVLRGLHDILLRDRPVIWCEIGAGTLSKIATAEELSRLVPFQFSGYQMISNQWMRGAVRLLERTRELPTGNYILVPK